MKSRFYIIVIALMALIQQEGCICTKNAMGNIPVVTQIPYTKFQNVACRRLIEPPLLFEIQTCSKDSIVAYEIYEGRKHSTWFSSSKWSEKTIYYITFNQVDNGTEYMLSSKTFEAPDNTYINWKKVEPSRKTKKYLIIQQLEK